MEEVSMLAMYDNFYIFTSSSSFLFQIPRNTLM